MYFDIDSYLPISWIHHIYLYFLSTHLCVSGYTIRFWLLEVMVAEEKDIDRSQSSGNPFVDGCFAS